MAREITKIVIRSMVVTLLSIVGVAVIFLALLSFTAPSAMARFTRDLGMYEQSAWFSSLQYDEGKGAIENIELAMNSSIMAGDEEGVVNYGTAFIQDSRFEEYSAQMEAQEAGLYKEPYSQYVYGRVAVACYRIGQKTEGLSLALSVNQRAFVEYNAVNDLITEVILCGDTAFAEQILSSLNTLYSSGAVSDTQFLNVAIQTLTVFVS